MLFNCIVLYIVMFLIISLPLIDINGGEENIAVKMIIHLNQNLKQFQQQLQEVWFYQTVLLSKCIFAFTPVMR